MRVAGDTKLAPSRVKMARPGTASPLRASDTGALALRMFRRLESESQESESHEDAAFTDEQLHAGTEELPVGGAASQGSDASADWLLEIL